MPNLIKYHIYVTFPGVGEIEVFPKNDTIKYGWQKTNDVWRKKIDTKLWFVNEPGAPKTFDIFASLELEECGCHRLDMRITVECPGADEILLFPGVLMFIDGEWFFDMCSVEIKPRVNDPFECLFKNWETDVNILVGSGSAVTLTTDTGNFEEVTCQADYPLEDFPGSPSRKMEYEDFCITGLPGGDWQVLNHTLTQATLDDPLFVDTTWIREIFNGAGPPPGAGWTMVTPIFWTRPAILQGPTIFEGFLYYEVVWELQSVTLDNGRLLSEVLINLFSVCDTYPLRSDFLGIDPDDTHPANDAYTYAEEWIHDAVVFQMSDVVRFGAFENATMALVNLSDLLTCLRTFWQGFLYFDEVNQVYRIEHISYERQTNLINMVTKRPSAIRGYNTYTYEKTRIPQKEIYGWSFDTNDEDWDNASIVYEDCNDVGRIEEYEIDCFHTDFGSLVGSGIEDIDVLKGLVIVAQKDGQIHRAAGDISGIIKPNAGLSWANVVRNLWRWRRPSCEALVNGVNTTFLSLIPKIRQTTFSAELCCMDVLALNPAIDRVRTGLGNGEFDQDVTMDLGSGMTQFDLLFAPPITLVDLTISISVNDDNQCYYTDFIFETVEDFPSGVVITWDFGVGAVPPTASGQGPHTVQYTTAGVKTVTVTASYAGDTTMAQTTVTVIACPASITGTVKNNYDVGVGSVNVRLFNDVDANGISDGGPFVKSVNTAGSGSWTMTGVLPGHYVIVLTVPSNYTIVSGIDSSNDLDVVPNVPTTDNVIPCTLTPSEIDANNNFIILPNNGTITGTVFDDLGNPINNAEINIYNDIDMDGVSDGGAPVGVAFTNAAGFYTIPGLTPVITGGPAGVGNYVIVLVVPVGYTIVSGIDGTADGDNVANVPTTDNIIPCTLFINETDATNNFIIQLTP